MGPTLNATGLVYYYQVESVINHLLDSHLQVESSTTCPIHDTFGKIQREASC